MNARATVLPFAFFTCLAGAAVAEESGTIRFPDGYRNWFMDHSTISLPGHTPEDEVSIQHVYANPTALKGLETGKYDDGSIFVVDRFAIIEDNNKTLSQGDRKVIGVMERDQQRFKDTGGWGFEAFKGGDAAQKLVKDAGKTCFGCHAPHADNSFLFTRLHR